MQRSLSEGQLLRIGVADTHHMRHGRLGDSRCRLYTRDKMTRRPMKPCTICEIAAGSRFERQDSHFSDEPEQ